MWWNAAVTRTADMQHSGKQLGFCPLSEHDGHWSGPVPEHRKTVCSPRLRKKALTGACPSRRAPVFGWIPLRRRLRNPAPLSHEGRYTVEPICAHNILAENGVAPRKCDCRLAP